MQGSQSVQVILPRRAELPKSGLTYDSLISSILKSQQLYPSHYYQLCYTRHNHTITIHNERDFNIYEEITDFSTPLLVIPTKKSHLHWRSVEEARGGEEKEEEKEAVMREVRRVQGELIEQVEEFKNKLESNIRRENQQRMQQLISNIQLKLAEHQQKSIETTSNEAIKGESLSNNKQQSREHNIVKQLIDMGFQATAVRTLINQYPNHTPEELAQLLLSLQD